MAVYTAIDDPEAYFQTVIYTGNGSANNAITLPADTDMQPDLVWIKNRETTDVHCLFDAVRGATKFISSNNTAAETTDADTLDSFTSDGFQVDADDKVNTNTEDYVSWNWKAGTSFTNDASATSVGNTDSSGSASSTAGFSISTYAGVGSSLDIQVKHGLGVAPAVMIVKNLSSDSWAVYHHKNTSAPETDYLKLDTTAATTDDADAAETWLDTAPTSAIFTAGDFSATNRATDNHVGYFWNEVQGFSKFGSYKGNNNANGPFVYLGFRPAYLVLKRIESSGGEWLCWDNKRTTFNEMTKALALNDNLVEDTTKEMDFLSNGFKIRTTDTNYNAAEEYVYMAFAEAPFVNSNGVPCNAR